jgi:hypothetical protein
MLVWPERFFCFAWLFVFLILDPICYARKGRSLLGQLAEGDNTRLVALLVAGVACGLVWELWNLGARTKWIYSVPFFDELKLGEMPVLGFLGFPPFAVECYAVVNFLSLLRDGRSWELDAGENLRRRGMSRGLARWSVAILAALIPLLAWIVIVSQTVSSFSTPLDVFFARDLGPRGVEAIRSSGARYSHEFLRLREAPAGVSPALFERMREISALAEIKGMGLRRAEALWALGIRNAKQLARQEPETLVRRIGETSGARVRPAWAKVWVREARRRCVPNP